MSPPRPWNAHQARSYFLSSVGRPMMLAAAWRHSPQNTASIMMKSGPSEWVSRRAWKELKALTLVESNGCSLNCHTQHISMIYITLSLFLFPSEKVKNDCERPNLCAALRIPSIDGFSLKPDAKVSLGIIQYNTVVLLRNGSPGLIVVAVNKKKLRAAFLRLGGAARRGPRPTRQLRH